jgi:hypothetical protein
MGRSKDLLHALASALEGGRSDQVALDDFYTCHLQISYIGWSPGEQAQRLAHGDQPGHYFTSQPSAGADNQDHDYLLSF